MVCCFIYLSSHICTVRATDLSTKASEFSKKATDLPVETFQCISPKEQQHYPHRCPRKFALQHPSRCLGVPGYLAKLQASHHMLDKERALMVTSRNAVDPAKQTQLILHNNLQGNLELQQRMSTQRDVHDILKGRQPTSTQRSCRIFPIAPAMRVTPFWMLNWPRLLRSSRSSSAAPAGPGSA